MSVEEEIKQANREVSDDGEKVFAGWLSALKATYPVQFAAWEDKIRTEAPQDIPLWSVSFKHIWRAGDRVESVLGGHSGAPQELRPGTVVEVSESVFRHEHLIVLFDDGEQRAVNPDVMRHHKFKRNDPGANEFLAVSARAVLTLMAAEARRKQKKE